MTFARRTRGPGRSLARAGGRVVARAPGRATAPAAGAAATIYEQLTVDAVNAYLQGLLGTSSDLTPRALYTADAPGGTLTDLGPNGWHLTGQNGATTIVSAHGMAAELVEGNGGVKSWLAADGTPFTYGTGAWARLMRLWFTTPPAFQNAWLGKGAGASPHYCFLLGTDGHLSIRAKQMGGPTVATIAKDVTSATPAPFWFGAGRSATDQKLKAFVVGAALAEAAFANTIDLTGFGSTFGYRDTINDRSVTGGIDHDVEFDGAPAEVVLANLATLVTALEAAE